MKAQSAPFSHRIIDINIDFPLPMVDSGRNFISRNFGGDEDKDEENDNKNEESNKDNESKDTIIKIMRMVTNNTMMLMTN